MKAQGLLAAAIQSMHDVASDLARQEAEQNAQSDPAPEYGPTGADVYMLQQRLQAADEQVTWLHQSAATNLQNGMPNDAGFSFQLGAALKGRDALAQQLEAMRLQQAQQNEAERQRADARWTAETWKAINTPPTQAPAPGLPNADSGQ